MKLKANRRIIQTNLERYILLSTLEIKYGYFVVISRPIAPVINLTSVILDPSQVIKKINDIAFRLELPPSMKIHLIFHVSLLEPYKTSSIPGRSQVPPPSVEIEGIEEFEVSKILDSRIIRRKLEYLIHWQGYDINERTWEPAANLCHAPEMIQDFHHQYPKKPSPKNT